MSDAAAAEFREKMRLMASKGKTTNNPNNGATNKDVKFKWIKILLNIWILKQSALLFSFFIPGGLMIWKFFFTAEYKFDYFDSLQTTPWIDLVKGEFNYVSSIRHAALPHVINAVPVVESLMIGDILGEIPTFSSSVVKISKNNTFKYYSKVRSWSSNLNFYNSSDATEMTLDELKDSEYRKYMRHSILNSYFSRSGELKRLRPTLDEVEIFACEDNNTLNFYCTSPGMLPHIGKFASSLLYLFATQSSQPRVSLWISSTAATAAMHYDLDDNFLLQLSGNKTVTLMSPEGYEVAEPFSSFHPEWRQSQHWKELTNSDQIISAVQQRYPVFSCDSSVAVADQYKKPLGLGLWEVTLSAGDMLYIPAGFYHTVTAGADSVSVNAWFPSKVSQLHRNLGNIELPFFKKDPLSTKLAFAAAVVRAALLGLPNPNPEGSKWTKPADSCNGEEGQGTQAGRGASRRRKDRKIPLPEAEREDITWQLLSFPAFIRGFRARYSGQESMFPPLANLTICTDSVVKMADTTLAVRRVSAVLLSFLTASNIRPALLAVMLMDYLEDVVLLAVEQEKNEGSNISRVVPSFMDTFAMQCLCVSCLP